MMTLLPLALAATVFVECESFQKLGGWTVETQSMRQLGSSYVMAHGYGKPVVDAETEVELPEAGEYVVWARTRNWNAEWTKGAAGRFEVEIRGVGDNKRTTTRELGAGEKEWHWEKAGVFKLAAGRHALALHDLTGFNGRCDALDANTNPSRSRT